MAQNTTKWKEDQHQGDTQFQEGDWVFLRLQPYKQSSLKPKKGLETSSKIYGPYNILWKIGEED